jgi:RimJ/RimL family protein N-acetyltransferase
MLHLGLDIVQLDVLAANKRARAIYAGWGFEEEGLRLATPLRTLALQLARLSSATASGSQSQ